MSRLAGVSSTSAWSGISRKVTWEKNGCLQEPVSCSQQNKNSWLCENLIKSSLSLSLGKVDAFKWKGALLASESNEPTSRTSLLVLRTFTHQDFFSFTNLFIFSLFQFVFMWMCCPMCVRFSAFWEWFSACLLPRLTWCETEGPEWGTLERNRFSVEIYVISV